MADVTQCWIVSVRKAFERPVPYMVFMSETDAMRACHMADKSARAMSGVQRLFYEVSVALHFDRLSAADVEAVQEAVQGAQRAMAVGETPVGEG